LSRGWIAAALALAAALAFPAASWAGHARTPECPQELCAGVAADGSRIVFPFAEELTPGVIGPDVYEWSAGRLRALVATPKGPAHRPAIGLDGASADLSHVFVETAYSLVPEDTDGGLTDIYDVGGATPVLVSTGPLDAARNGASFSSYVGTSADGSRVFFSALTPFAPEEPGNCGGVYERANGVTTPIAIATKPQQPLPPNLCDSLSFGGVSGDDSHLFFTTSRDLIAEDEGGDDIYQRVGGALSVVTTYPERVGNSNCVDLPQFAGASADGATVLFTTNTAISSEDTDQAFDVYKREPDGSFVLVSRGTEGGSGCGFGGDRAVALSADGRIAIFETRARLSTADTDSSNDLYRAEDGQPPLLISTGPTDPNADEQSKVFPDWVTAASSDARTVAFETKEPLVAADSDRSMDVYVNVDGATELASTGPAKGGAGSAAELLGLSADGSTVVFATKGRLTESDLDRDRDVYLRRVAGKRTLLLSGEQIPPRIRIVRNGRLQASGKAVVRVGCPKAETSGPCHVTMALSRGRKRLGHASFQIDAGSRGPVSIRLPRSFSPRRSVRVLVRVRGSDQLGNSSVTTARVRLALRGKAAAGR
jgi:hypothetical protein